MRSLKLAAVVSLLSLACVAELRHTRAEQDPPARLFELVGMAVPFEQRVGVDDGAAFVVHFSGDTQGNLDTCG